jgi:hypothetical protein
VPQSDPKRQEGERGFQIVGEAPPEPEARRGSLPSPTFGTFVLSLSASALVHLGEAQAPDSKEPSPQNLPLARHTIDILEMLAEKTQGNLETEERELLEGVLHDLRMRYVRASSERKS